MSIRFYNQFNRAAVTGETTPAPKKPRAAKAKAPAKKKARNGQA